MRSIISTTTSTACANRNIDTGSDNRIILQPSVKIFQTISNYIKPAPHRNRFNTHTFSTFLFAILLFIVTLQASHNVFSADTFYVVKPGDTLWDISKKKLNNPADWKKLQKLNKIKNPKKLTPNSLIRIPESMTRKKENYAIIEHTQGRVSIKKENGEEIIATPNMTVSEGDKIYTKASSSITLKFKNGSTSSLQENSQLTVKKIQLPEESEAEKEIRLHLIQGNITNDVKKSKTPHSRFIISTPSAVASVRGTVFRVANNPLTQQFRTEVLEGSVSVSSQNKVIIIKKGFGITIKKGEIPSQPTKLLAAANLSDLQQIFKKAPVFFRFPAVENAISYRIELSLKTSQDQTVHQQVLAQNNPKPEITFANLKEGNYIMRVFPYNNNGLGGQAAYHQFNVVLPIKIPLLQTPTLIFPENNSTVEQNQFTFLWGESVSASGYHFQLANDSKFQNLHINIFPYHTTSLAISDRLISGRYYWHVAALDKNNKSRSFTETRAFIIPPPIPLLSDATYAKGSIQLNWRINSKVLPYKIEHRHQYRLQVSRKKEFSTFVINTIISDTNFQFKPKELGDYFIRVSSIAPDGYLGKTSQIQHLKLAKKGTFGREMIHVGENTK